MMPSAKDSARFSTGYLVCSVRNGGAILSGLGLTLSTAWHGVQFARQCQSPLGARLQGMGWDAGGNASRIVRKFCRQSWQKSLF